MAVVSRKSGPITDRAATPQVMADHKKAGGFLREACGTLETVNADSIGSIYRFCEIPSGARVSDIKLSADDIGATTAADFGLYRTTADGAAVVDADFFASAVVLNAGALNSSLIGHESGVFDIDDTEKRVWEALGLASDPNINYDVAATLTGAADAAGTISVKVQYVA